MGRAGQEYCGVVMLEIQCTMKEIIKKLNHKRERNYCALLVEHIVYCGGEIKGTGT